MHISQLFLVEALRTQKHSTSKAKNTPLWIGTHRFALAIFLSLSISFLFIPHFTYADNFTKELCDKDPDAFTLNIENSILNAIHEEKEDHNDSDCTLDPNTFKKINQINNVTAKGYHSQCSPSLTNTNESNVNTDNDEKAVFLINMLLWRANISQEINKTNVNEILQSALNTCEKTSENISKKINRYPPPLTQLSLSNIQSSSSASSSSSTSFEEIKENQSEKLIDETPFLINTAIQIAEQFFLNQNSSLIKKNRPNRNSDISSASSFISDINSPQEKHSPTKTPPLKRSSAILNSSSVYTFKTEEDINFPPPRDSFTQYLVQILISDPSIKNKNYNDQRKSLHSKLNSYNKNIPEIITTLCKSPTTAKKYLSENQNLLDKFKFCNSNQNKTPNSLAPFSPKLFRSSLSHQSPSSNQSPSTPTMQRSLSYKNITKPLTPKLLTNLQLSRPLSISADSASSSPPSTTRPLSARGNSQKKSSISINTPPLTPRGLRRLSSVKPNEIPKNRTELAEEDLNNIFEQSFNRELEKLFTNNIRDINNQNIKMLQFKGRFNSFDSKSRYQFVRDLNQLYFANQPFLIYDLIYDKDGTFKENKIKTTHPIELAIKIIHEIETTNCDKTDCYEPLEKLRYYTARMAYMYNIQTTLRTIAKENHRPFGIRIPSDPSQSLQQMGFATKPLEIKNKSSLISIIKRKGNIPGLDGFIPMDGNLGKNGTSLKKLLLNQCTTNNKSSDCEDSKKQETQKAFDEKQIQLRKKIEEDTAIAQNLLTLKDDQGSPLYTQVHRTRKRYYFIKGDFVTEIAVLENTEKDPNTTHLRKISWVEYHPSHPPQNIAHILADRWGNPITADTDFLFMPTEKDDSEVKYDLVYGHHTNSDLIFINKINEKWRNLSSNYNDIVQHGHEFLFGLNTLDGQVLLVNSKGKIDIINISDPKTNAKASDPKTDARAQDFKQVAEFIKKDLEHSKGAYTIHIPTPQEQHENYEHLKAHIKTDFHLDFTQATEDFKVMQKVLTPPTGPKPDSTQLDDSKLDKTKDESPAF